MVVNVRIILRLITKYMKKKNKLISCLSEFLYKIYGFLIRKEPCILYRRPYSYNIDDTDGYNNQCPFCDPTEKIIEETNLFLILPNRYPYPRTENHILVCPKRHIKDWMKLTTKELLELRNIMS